MLLLISDANILIDMEAGELMAAFFALPMQFAMPDILYEEEIEPGSPGLKDRGLAILTIDADWIDYALELPRRYGDIACYNDYLALALAKQEGCPLLTGDQGLRQTATAEQVDVMGTLWLMRAMIEQHIISVDEALSALTLMKQRGRRLPWSEAERILNSLRRS
ncbi:MAG: PIN domain-containing protein [Chromatiaceae bacterium]|nr:PIN domain-containing protein [Chromatiaceae bacterium]MCF7996195.1 PIN domain-containing protein [Chromatiaceae bacterium]MCF8016125.1 PIN domain-containing protein [Chromatiaceae bacterium]